MKYFIIILLSISPLYSNGQFKNSPELTSQVNSFTISNAIPWYKNEKFTYKFQAQFSHSVPLTKIIKGDYSYTLYRLHFHSIKNLKEKFNEPNLIMYLERKFPTTESKIKFKELWPFNAKHKQFIFKTVLDKKAHKIVSIELPTKN